MYSVSILQSEFRNVNVRAEWSLQELVFICQFEEIRFTFPIYTWRQEEDNCWQDSRRQQLTNRCTGR